MTDSSMKIKSKFKQTNHSHRGWEESRLGDNSFWASTTRFHKDQDVQRKSKHNLWEPI